MQALSQFKRILKPGGLLLIDERNYQHLLDNRDAILQGNTSFYVTNPYLYGGDRVKGRAIGISDSRIEWEMTDQWTGKVIYGGTYPFKRGELKALLRKAGFTVARQYSDFKPGEDPKAGFYQYVCLK